MNMTEVTRLRMRRFVAARLSPEGEFGLHLTVGGLLIVLASALFAAIANQVESRATLTVLDARLAVWLHAHAHANELLTQAMLFITNVHSVPGVIVLGGLFAAWLWRQRERFWLQALLCALPSGELLNVILKHLFERPRPVFDAPLLNLATYSFPSGHTAGATVLWGLVACYAARRLPPRHAWLAAAGALVLVALVAFSRMYLGAHYLSDVLAAAAEGSAWLALWLTCLSTLWRRQHRR